MYRLARRLARPLAFLVIAAQLLLVVPAMANATVSAAATTEMHCDHTDAHGDAPCPCCPDGASSGTDCLVSCMLSAVAAPAIFVATAALPDTPEFIQTTFAPDPFFQPPLNPPPIA